jgi:hypothetical protein
LLVLYGQSVWLLLFIDITMVCDSSNIAGVITLHYVIFTC